MSPILACFLSLAQLIPALFQLFNRDFMDLFIKKFSKPTNIQNLILLASKLIDSHLFSFSCNRRILACFDPPPCSFCENCFSSIVTSHQHKFLNHNIKIFLVKWAVKQLYFPVRTSNHMEWTFNSRSQPSGIEYPILYCPAVYKTLDIVTQEMTLG